MDLSLTVALNTAEMTITLDDQTQIIIRQDKRLPKKEKGLLFFLNQKQLIALGLTDDITAYKNITYDQSIRIITTQEISIDYLAQAFMEEAIKKGITLEMNPTTVTIPASSTTTITKTSSPLF